MYTAREREDGAGLTGDDDGAMHTEDRATKYYSRVSRIYVKVFQTTDPYCKVENDSNFQHNT